MIKELFEPTLKVIKAAISKADTAEEQIACNNLIEHCQEDFAYAHIPNFHQGISDLREALQAKHDELTREDQPQC